MSKKLPQNYHVEAIDDSQIYRWYYLGRKEGAKDYVHKKYFKSYDAAVNNAISYYNKQKSKKQK